MPDTIYAGECSPIESRTEIASLEGLQHKRRQLLGEYAALKALHGPNGKWDNRRKQFLELAKIKCRMDLQKKGEKVTETYVDALAHADEDYGNLITQGIEGAVRYIQLDTEMREIEEQIESRSAELYFLSAEARLQR